MLFADKGPAIPLSAPERGTFLHQFSEMAVLPLIQSPLFMEQNFNSCDVAWWVRSQDESTKHSNCKDPSLQVDRVQGLFTYVHSSVSRNVVFHYMPFTNSISSALGIEHVTLHADTSERR